MKKQRGISLVELMVAMVIALIALGAGTALLVSTNQTVRVQRLQDTLTQEGRFLMNMHQQLISQAGYRNTISGGMPSQYLSAVSDTELSVGFIGDNSQTTGCRGETVTGINTLVLRQVGSCLQCGPAGGPARCPAGANVQSWVAPEATDGVELASLKYEYGVDTGPNTPSVVGCGVDISSGVKARDCVADVYSLASAQANPSQVVAVRVCLVLRTVKTDSSLVKAAPVLDCNGVAIGGSQTDNKLYRRFSTTVLLKNR